ncbi:MAG: hypothetical protein JWO38_6348 [Gemmataceae bacterium]|nr:hypothetical protein [Gemmataceae bacterium]
MERDAPSVTPPSDVVPPVPWEAVRRVGLAGAGMTAAAALLGLVATAAGDGTPWVLGTLRLALVFAGAVTAGLAVSFNSGLWQTWAVGAATAVLAVAGTPAHWDSFRILFGVLAGVAAIGAVVVGLPPVWRVRVISAAIVVHFGGIFLATTSPSPVPWLVEQLYRRVYEPYLQFVYLRNAYHFYSPEPGPASLLCCLLKTEVGEEESATGERRKKYETRWVVVPRRPADVKDPLGVAYYRRLSLTDQVSRVVPDVLNAETQERRSRLTLPGADPQIPLNPGEPVSSQYRFPYPEVTRYVLPSYARHLILEYTPDAATAARTTVKLYRLEHRTLQVQEYTGTNQPGKRPVSPYHPSTYRPYFLGEFGFVKDPTDPTRPHRVELLDPQAGMLYWLVPIIHGSGSPPPGGKDFNDYLSKHAGSEFDWSQLR